VANLLLTWRLLPETAPAPKNVGVATLARGYGGLLASPAFLGYAVGGGCATTSMFAFVAAAPFIFVQQLDRPAHEVGIYLAVLISGIWLGSALVSRLIGKVSLDRLLVRSNLLSVLAAFLFLAVVLAGSLGVVAVVGTTFLFAIGVGMAAPTALTKAIGVDARLIGSASGLYGFVQMTVGALCTALAGVGADPALSVALVLAVSGILAQLSFWIALRRPPSPGAAAS
jgi:DHA1 family bicyclomycin/chloramphenicol resistance-like MFS transporter